MLTLLGSAPLLDTTGLGARDRGRAHGEELRALVTHGVARWSAQLEAAYGAPAADVTARFLSATGHRSAVARELPDLLEEVRGIGEGAGVPFDTIFAYNLWDEEQHYRGEHGGRCTTVGLRSGAGAPVSAQNMDILAEPIAAILVDGPGPGATLVLTLAGMVGLCGVNSAGVSVLCNALHELAHSPSGVPVAFVVRALLTQPVLASARSLAERMPHAVGQNYLIGSPDGVVSLECSATASAEVRPDGEAVWHANHPIVLDAARAVPPYENSIARDAYVARTVAGATSVEDVKAILADRTVPVCKVESPTNPDTQTIWAIVVRHAQTPEVFVAPGPPDRTAWQSFSFDRVPSSPTR